MKQLLAELPADINVEEVIEMNKKLNAGKQQIEGLEERNTHLGLEIKEMKEECSLMETKIIALKDDNLLLNRQLLRVREEKSELQQTLTHLEGEYENMRLAEEETASQLQAMVDEKDDLMQTLAKKEEEIKQVIQTRREMILHHQEEMEVIRKEHHEKLEAEESRAVALAETVREQEEALVQAKGEVERLVEQEKALLEKDAKRDLEKMETIQAVTEGMKLKLEHEIKARKEVVDQLTERLEVTKYAAFHASTLALKLASVDNAQTDSVSILWEEAKAASVGPDDYMSWLNIRLSKPSKRLRKSNRLEAHKERAQRQRIDTKPAKPAKKSFIRTIFG